MSESDSDSNPLEAVADSLGDIVSGVPAPIRKNALKAFGRLCSAGIEYPVTLIENAIAERKAESKARIKIIENSASQISTQMATDPEYARVAVKKFGERILRERVNIDSIAHAAAEELSTAPDLGAQQSSEETAAPISDDWINAFENEAAQMSSEQMQKLFAKILAGEIRRPGSSSIKTLRLLSQLDNDAAQIFSILCSLSISLRLPDSSNIFDARVASLGRNAGQNSLQQYGLAFGALNILEEYGLIISDYNSYMDYKLAVVNNNHVALPITYQNTRLILSPEKDFVPNTEIRVHGVAFTKAGRELLPIVDVIENVSYTTELAKFFKQLKLDLHRI